MKNNFLESSIKQFEYYKILGDKTFSQLSDEQLFIQINNESNSIATIVKTLMGKYAITLDRLFDLGRRKRVSE